MDINIYKTYRFAFDPDEYTRNFKEALREKSIKMPADFNDRLKKAGIDSYDYESVKSYFYGRRVPPFDVFAAVCKNLHLNADAIAFPHSIPDPRCAKDICDCEHLFRNVFYPYNPGEENLTEFFYAETYERDVDALTSILLKYNYLIQKYHYAAVSNVEWMQIVFFTERYIVEREKEGTTSAEEVMAWIRDCDEEEFLTAFYEKYTLAYYTMPCHSLLNILSTAIDGKLISYAAQLLPAHDRSVR
jgi:hypothetical protein